MTDVVVCAHHWGDRIEPMTDGTPFRMCYFCNTVWYEGDNEPRVVTGRIEKEDFA